MKVSIYDFFYFIGRFWDRDWDSSGLTIRVSLRRRDHRLCHHFSRLSLLVISLYLGNIIRLISMSSMFFQSEKMEFIYGRNSNEEKMRRKMRRKTRFEKIKVCEWKRRRIIVVIISFFSKFQINLKMSITSLLTKAFKSTYCTVFNKCVKM